MYFVSSETLSGCVYMHALNRMIHFPLPAPFLGQCRGWSPAPCAGLVLCHRAPPTASGFQVCERESVRGSVYKNSSTL